MNARYPTLTLASTYPANQVSQASGIRQAICWTVYFRGSARRIANNIAIVAFSNSTTAIYFTETGPLFPMADRHAPSARVLTSGVSKARNGMTSATAHSVRRNLFQNQLTRRPPALSPTSDEELHLDDDVHKEHQSRHHGQFQSQPDASFPQDDIVVRNHNGEIELGDPPTLPLDDAEDMEALEARHENEMERQRLAEAVKQHQIDRHSVPAQPEGKDPSSSTSSKCSATHTTPRTTMTKTSHFASSAELLEAVRASLRAKVAALDEDNWLYESGQPSQLRQ